MSKTVNKYAKISIISFATLLLVSTLIYFNNSDNKSLQGSVLPASGQAIVGISASYPKDYPDLKSLYDDVDVVVLGTVDKVKPSKKEGDLVFTDSEFKVKKYYKSPQKSKYIILHQDGGTISGTEYRNAELPLLNEGKEYVLFLKHIRDDNRYFIISPVGMYKVENGYAIHKESARNKALVGLEKNIQELGSTITTVE